MSIKKLKSAVITTQDFIDTAKRDFFKNGGKVKKIQNQNADKNFHHSYNSNSVNVSVSDISEMRLL